MAKNFIPTCKFPSTVMFIEDQPGSLQGFMQQLDPALSCVLYDSPHDALQHIHHSHLTPPNNDIDIEATPKNNHPLSDYAINLDLAAIHSEIYNPRRFSEVSVVVLDIGNKEMNCMEFCKRMEDSPIKRILLSDRTDERSAISAFNDGLIDLFIHKRDPNAVTLLKNGIEAMQQHYFQSMSSVIVKMLSVEAPICLEDPVFVETFKNIVHENNIVEYYLTENSGSYLMLDAAANVSYLITKSDFDLALHLELAMDNNAPQQVIDELKAGRQLPFTVGSDFLQLDWNDWSNFLYPAKCINGQHKYYYAYIKNPWHTSIIKDKIMPYNQYLNQSDKMNS